MPEAVRKFKEDGQLGTFQNCKNKYDLDFKRRITIVISINCWFHFEWKHSIIYSNMKYIWRRPNEV